MRIRLTPVQLTEFFGGTALSSTPQWQEADDVARSRPRIIIFVFVLIVAGTLLALIADSRMTKNASVSSMSEPQVTVTVTAEPALPSEQAPSVDPMELARKEHVKIIAPANGAVKEELRLTVMSLCQHVSDEYYVVAEQFYYDTWKRLNGKYNLDYWPRLEDDLDRMCGQVNPKLGGPPLDFYEA